MEKKQTSGVDPSRVKVDGWANILTGIGIKGKDKRLGAVAEWERLVESDAEQLYASDDIASKVAEYPVEDSLREGWKLIGIEEEESKKLETEFHDRLKLNTKVELAWKYGRIYGGGGLLLMTDDTTDFSTPLNPQRVKSIRTVLAFTRWELQAGEIDSDLLSPNYGLPKYYSLSPRGGQTGSAGSQKFHHSRVIRFEGKLLPPRLFVQNQYWHDSHLNQLKNSLLNFNTSHDAAANALQDFRVAVFKLKNLQSLIANNQDDLVRKRLDILNMSKSIAKALVIDADGESMEHSTTSFAGVPELLDKMTKRLQAATPIPHTRLFGNSPAGMGGTGRAEEANYYDYVSQLQENYLHPILMRLYKLIAAQGTVNMTLPITFDVEFNPLWQMDESEQAALHGKQAAADQIYLENGVLDPQEVRKSRFGSGKYSANTQLEAVPVLDPQAPETTVTADPGSTDVAKQALNGAQVSSLLETVMNAAQGLLPRESGVKILTAALPFLSEQEADQIIGEAGRGFKSATPPPFTQDEEDCEDGEMCDDCPILDGGPGSGCSGPNCGRPSGSGGSASKSAAKQAKAADRKVESAGNAFDKNPTPENEAKLKEALKARGEANVKVAEARIQETESKIKELKEKTGGQSEAGVKELESKLASVRERKAAAEKAMVESQARTAALKERLKTLQGKKDSEDLIPPKSVQEAAAQGLEMRKKWGRGGTNIGVKRAADLAEGKPLSRTTLARMASYRKQMDACDITKRLDDGGPTPEMIAIMLWGGKEGIEWAEEKLEEINGRQ